MFATEQRWQFGDRFVEQLAVRAPGLVFASTRCCGISTMELASGRDVRGRGWVWLVISGEAMLETSSGPLIVGPSQVCAASGGAARLVQTSEDVHLVQWVYKHEAPAASTADVVRVRQAPVAAMAEFTRGWANLAREPGAHGQLPRGSAQELFAAMEALDVPGPSRETLRSALRGTPTARDLEVARLVMAASCDLSVHPGMDDFSRALHLDERRCSEVVAGYFRSYHPNFVGWRDYLATLRAELAWNLLSAKESRCARVAEWLGFRSAPAMYHALSKRGLDVKAR